MSDRSENISLMDSNQSHDLTDYGTDNLPPPPPQSRPSFWGLFRYATDSDKISLILAALIGSVSSLLSTVGVFVAVLPITQQLRYEEMYRGISANVTVPPDVIQAHSEKLRQSSVTSLCISMGIGCMAFIFTTTHMYIFGSVSLRVSRRLRQSYLSQVLQLDMTWSQSRSSGELTTFLDEHMTKISDALENNLPQLINLCTYFFFSVLISLIIREDLALVTLCLILPIGIVFWLGTKYCVRMIEVEQSFLSRAAEIAAECFLCIKTVICFNGQKQTIEKYENNVDRAMQASGKRSLWSSIADAAKIVFLDSVVVVSIWYGANTLGDKDPSMTIAIVLLFLYQAYNIPVINMHANAIFVAISSAHEINKILEIHPVIESNKGETLNVIGPEISFKNVSFSYEERSDITVISNFSLDIAAGEKIAIVGESGSGKSTIAALLMRFYDPTSGKITLDGHPLTDLNVQWLRHQIGFVGQEAVLFDMSIRENVRCGYVDCTDEDIKEALSQAIALDFVMQMPDGLNTRAGERGTLLSGGEKQRIAIARALLRSPEIMIFDESTSSLDATSEAVVQDAIDRVSQGRTTITIAHRLSTVQNADRVLVMDKGIIVESGSPEQLINNRGLFFQLLKQQNLTQVRSHGTSQSETSDTEADTPILHRRRSQSFSSVLSLSLSDSEGLLDSDSSCGIVMADSFTYQPYNPALHGSYRHNEHLITQPEESTPSRWALKQVLEIHPQPRQLAPIILCSAFARAARLVMFTVIMAAEIDSMSFPNEVMERRLHYYVFLFAFIATVGFIGELGIYIPLPRYSDQLTARIRSLMLRHYLSQNMAYFDRRSHDSGNLSAALATHPANIREALSSKAPELLTNTIAVLAGFVTGMCVQAAMALIATGLHVVIVILRMVETAALVREEQRIQPLKARAVRLASEAFTNLETVKAYALEGYVCDRCTLEYAAFEKQKKKRIIANALLIGSMMSANLLTIGVKTSCGSFLMLKWHSLTVLRLQIAQNVISNSFARLLAIFTQTRPISRCFASCDAVARTLNERTTVNYLTTAGFKPPIDGEIKFKFVNFQYPSRPDAVIFKELDFHIKAGSTVAIVGSSGTGKSSILQLMLRLYECDRGEVLIDGTNVAALNPTHLHNMVVPVNQEPVLFNCSIWENICYGLDPETVTAEMVYTATRNSNIDDFIQSLPEKYSTQVGQLGTKLSTGQKQRIAIARALIREAPVLLLDEATAALDSASEALVQSTIDRAQRKCTCVIVAHRLSTVQNADVIFVLYDGRIVEKGNHHQLMKNKRLYYSMCMRQKAANQYFNYC